MSSQESTDVRLLALMALRGQPGADPAGKDVGFLNELVKGVHRERRFLTHVLSVYANKPPRKKTLELVLLGLYQALFMDHVPDHALFSSLKFLAKHEGLDPAEDKFIHGVVRKAKEESQRWLTLHKAVLEACAAGQPSALSALGAVEVSAVLNLDSALIDLVRASAKAAGLKGTDAWRALGRLKERAPLVGHYWPLATAEISGAVSLNSPCAPGAVIFSDTSSALQALRDKQIFIQGEASQWACAKAAELIVSRRSSLVRVLELAAGKGGKTLGTLARLIEIEFDVKNLNWTCVDNSPEQHDAYVQWTEPFCRQAKMVPEYMITDVLKSDDQSAGHGLAAQAFDFVWVDAPCSGLGTLSKHPEIAARLTPEAVNELAQQQTEMLLKASAFVAPGAYLFYSVCTFTQNETNMVCDEFIKQQPGFSLVEQKYLWPGTESLVTSDGFFGSVFLRR